MLFEIEQDLGAFLSGYVVCDGFSDVARIAITSRGGVVYERTADDLRKTFAATGRHATGQCGFSLDEARVPGLAGMDDLEIRDGASGALIYRRLRPQHVRRRILRIETHLFPLWRIDNALNGRFQYSANQIETCGGETVLQMLSMPHCPSIYLSGRLLYPAFQQDVEGKFDVIFSMHNPYEELAERLIVLAQMNRINRGILGLRDNTSLGPISVFAQALPLDDEAALARALRDIPLSVARVLANPVVRQLTTTTPEAMSGDNAVQTALAALAAFQVVGLRRAAPTFAAAIAELTGLEAKLPSDAIMPGVSALARVLRRTREVEWLIEQDLALYHQIAEAYRGATGLAENSPDRPARL